MTLEDLPEQSPAALDALPVEVLARLQAQAQTRLVSASQMVAILHGVLTRRYAQGLNETGTHRRAFCAVRPPGHHACRDKLAGVVETIRSWGENPADYVETKLSVSETSYKAWPPAIRDLFTPARTVKPGKAKFEIALGLKEAA